MANSGGCNPDGNFSANRTVYPDSGFSMSGKRFNTWSRDSLFQITFGFDSLPFSTVKINDVGWDVFVGA